MTFSYLGPIVAESRAALLDCKGHGQTSHCYLAVNFATVTALVILAILIMAAVFFLFTYFEDRS